MRAQIIAEFATAMHVATFLAGEAGSVKIVCVVSSDNIGL
jgi:hypothetical protein